MITATIHIDLWRGEYGDLEHKIHADCPFGRLLARNLDGLICNEEAELLAMLAGDEHAAKAQRREDEQRDGE
jgi:hypothetical protein